jgi:hypothetical protein
MLGASPPDRNWGRASAPTKESALARLASLIILSRRQRPKHIHKQEQERVYRGCECRMPMIGDTQGWWSKCTGHLDYYRSSWNQLTLADAQSVIIGSIVRRDWPSAVESTIAQLGS